MKLFFMFLFLSLFACSEKSATSEKSVVAVTAPSKIFETNQPATRNPADEMPADTTKVAKMAFTETLFDFGKVKEKDVVEHTFKFKNVGTVPLVISDAHSNCGCTVPEWPKEPIAVGAESQIKVIFKTESKRGKQVKPIRIRANTWPVLTEIYLKAEVYNPYIVQDGTEKPKRRTKSN